MAILLIPFLVMVTVNEIVRVNTDEAGYNLHGVHAINTGKSSSEKCSWVCHNNTDYCKENHVKWAQSYFAELDPLYFGIINTLQSTGKYGLANVILLVILLPLIMYFLLVKSIIIQMKIRKIKKG